MSFKSFAMIALAAAVSTGRSWQGRETEKSIVVYVAAEGGDALHIRRAGAELAADGPAGLLIMAQERPLLDDPTGAAMVRGILHGLIGDNSGKSPYLFSADKDRLFEVLNKLEDDFYKSDKRDLEDQELDDLLCITYPIIWEFSDKSLAYTIPKYPISQNNRIVCIIDTYSQTSCDDNKSNVSAYIKNLRDMIEAAARNGYELSFVVVDHVTKEGGSYLGSVAKLNDVDSQIEVIRDGGSMRTTLNHHKMKDGRESDPVHLELVPFIFPDHTDGYGNPLETLVARDGQRAAAIAGVAGGKAAILLSMLEAAGGELELAELRAGYRIHPDNAQAKPDSIDKSFRRAMADLLTDELIIVDGKAVRLTSF